MKTQTKQMHTPGPWKVHGSRAAGYAIMTPKGTIADVFICGEPKGDNVVANARLIAAAPELLDLVKFLKHWCDHGSAISPSMLTPSDATLKEVVNHIIDKVEGRDA